MELGMFCLNGNKIQKYECPRWIVALLNEINAKLSVVMWNKYQTEYESPFCNTGTSFKNDVFEVSAYNWNDKVEQPYNFKCGDIEISWYKYCGRGTTINDNYEERYIIEMFDKCMESLDKMQEEDE